MYVPRKFAETDRAILEQVVRTHDFGLLIGPAEGTPAVTHLPFRLEEGALVAHMARANPHWESFGPAREALVVFQGPHCYVSPRWYESHPAVPTWNYVAVHVHGVPEVIEDIEEVRSAQSALVEQYENGAWRLEDQPPEYIDGMLRAIVSFRMPVERIEGKFKLNQNKSAADRKRVIAELEKSDDPMARAVAVLMAERES